MRLMVMGGFRRRRREEIDEVREYQKQRQPQEKNMPSVHLSIGQNRLLTQKGQNNRGSMIVEEEDAGSGSSRISRVMDRVNCKPGRGNQARIRKWWAGDTRVLGSLVFKTNRQFSLLLLLYI